MAATRNNQEGLVTAGPALRDLPFQTRGEKCGLARAALRLLLCPGDGPYGLARFLGVETDAKNGPGGATRCILARNRESKMEIPRR
jgi:hypothetical protein